ncbi:hypothetical protein OIO90_003579 [Microbotryomycetes sp. JL221]|nr:hypothetical protein OIO90_003579 [Microbotryomycetes sp. JL221]
MSIWTRSMWGVGWKANGANADFEFWGGDPYNPLGPNWAQDDWWFRGPEVRSLPPLDGEITHLPAGGSVTFEIACHVAWTSFGVSPTVPGSLLDACPGNSGSYHSGDPTATDIDRSMVSGCALGIADVDDIDAVTMDNLAIFSVQQKCVQQKVTSFAVPARMPACSSAKGCICGWFWLANNGTANFYMTAFRCDVTGSPVDATPIAPPVDPTWCDPTELQAGRCQTQGGAKRPIYAYNTPTNVPWKGNYDRPGYHDNWSFRDGAQNDIFLPANATISKPPTVSATPSATTSAAPFKSTAVNLASSATVTASSENAALNQTASKAIDGVISGSPTNPGAEWVTSGQGQGAWLKLTWPAPQMFNQIVLYDRPNLDDRIITSSLVCDDGAYVNVGVLNNDGSATVVNLVATGVTCQTVTFYVNSVSPTTQNTGLSEIQVYMQAPSTPVATATSVLSSVVSQVVSSVSSVSSSVVSQAAPPVSSVLSNVVSAVASTPSASAPAQSPPVNLALTANVQGSSSAAGSSPALAVDGNPSTEWVTNNEKNGAQFYLTWPTAQQFNQMVLYDRASPTDQITSLNLLCSDGSGVNVGPLNNDGSATVITLPTVSCTAVLMTVLAVSDTTTAVGLADVQIYLQNGPVATATTSAAALSSSPAAPSVAPSSVTSSVAPSSVVSSFASSAAPASSVTSSSAAQSSAPALSSAAPASSATQVSAVAPSSANPVSTSKTSSAAASSTSAASAPVSTVNVARSSRTSASSQLYGFEALRVIDGTSNGWLANRQRVGAWLRLSWTQATKFNQIVLYGMPSNRGLVTGATLTFSDGTRVNTGMIRAGVANVIQLPLITSNSVTLTVTSVSSGTSAAGLVEMQAFVADSTKFTNVLTPTKPASKRSFSLPTLSPRQLMGNAVEVVKRVFMPENKHAQPSKASATGPFKTPAPHRSTIAAKAHLGAATTGTHHRGGAKVLGRKDVNLAKSVNGSLQRQAEPSNAKLPTFKSEQNVERTAAPIEQTSAMLSPPPTKQALSAEFRTPSPGVRRSAVLNFSPESELESQMEPEEPPIDLDQEVEYAGPSALAFEEPFYDPNIPDFKTTGFGETIRALPLLPCEDYDEWATKNDEEIRMHKVELDFESLEFDKNNAQHHSDDTSRPAFPLPKRTALQAKSSNSSAGSRLGSSSTEASRTGFVKTLSSQVVRLQPTFMGRAGVSNSVKRNAHLLTQSRSTNGTIATQNPTTRPAGQDRLPARSALSKTRNVNSSAGSSSSGTTGRAPARDLNLAQRSNPAGPLKHSALVVTGTPESERELGIFGIESQDLSLLDEDADISELKLDEFRFEV